MSVFSRRVSGRLRIALVATVVAGGVAAYVWGIFRGEATAVTAATAILVFALGEYFRRRLTAQQYRWDKIAPQYEAFLSHLRALAAADDRTRAHLTAKSERLMGEFGDKLVLWGSSRVIKAWVDLRRLGEESNTTVAQQISAYGRMLRAIRKEFGHDDLALEERDLFRVVLNEEIDSLAID